MEEIKNWWGVFGLFGCVTVVSSSLERRCHRQGYLAALTNPAISNQWHASRECYLLAHVESTRSVSVCVCVFYWALNNVFLCDLCVYFLFDLRSSAQLFLSRCVGGFGYSE